VTDTTTCPAPSNEDMCSDSYVFHMSIKQAEMLDDWKRPVEALPPPLWPSPGDLAGDSAPEFMHSHTEIDLVQDAATDCSVVASLTAAHARRKRGFGKVRSVRSDVDCLGHRCG